MLVSATASTTGGDNTVGLPSDFLEMRDLYIVGNPRFPISYRSPSAFTRDTRAGESGKPVFYTLLGNEIELSPIPDTNYTLNMLYYAKPTPLSDSVSSNAFMANCPDALLYASLAEAEPYLMNDSRLQVWAAMYQNAIDALNISDQSSEYSGVPLNMTVTR